MIDRNPKVRQLQLKHRSVCPSLHKHILPICVSMSISLDDDIFVCGGLSLPSRNFICGKVMFLHPSVILFKTGRQEGVCGGGCAWRGGACVQERRPLKRAVRILLECILVCNNFLF